MTNKVNLDATLQGQSKQLTRKHGGSTTEFTAPLTRQAALRRHLKGDDHMDTHEDIRALIRRHMEEMWHARKPQVVEHTTHPERTTHGLTDDEVRGHEQHQEVVRSYQEAFSDLRFRIE